MCFVHHFEVSPECIAVNLAYFGYLALGYAFFHEFSDKRFLSAQFVFVRCAAPAFWSAEDNTFGTFAGESLFGALGDEVALNLCRQPEGEGKDFRLDVVAEAVVVFDSPDFCLLGHADVEYLHYHEEVATESRQFSADDEVILFDALEQRAELPLGVCLCAGDSFLDPAVYGDVLAAAEVVDFKALVLYGLLVGADPDISVNHVFSCNVRKSMIRHAYSIFMIIGIMLICYLFSFSKIIRTKRKKHTATKAITTIKIIPDITT